ncbi:Hypothetical_protein [Hexamita inflata]|uniref:Hypothetical_protein n=1 Tax=Hexamita inflata TaxID=28002 RepID=A0AA86PKT2_9EUKA|nr:Hypothetical protein HINF_LOCUS29465 [Hexamita inflata]
MPLKERTLVGDGEGQLKIDLRGYRERQGLTDKQIIHVVTQVDACAMTSNPKLGSWVKITNLLTLKQLPKEMELGQLNYLYMHMLFIWYLLILNISQSCFICYYHHKELETKK